MGLSDVIVGLSGGFLLGNTIVPNLRTDSKSVTLLSLQQSVNDALINSMKYEKLIADLNQKLADAENSGPTVDFLKLQLEDLQENYDQLMIFVRSKVPELPTSFEVVESNVEGLHHNPSLVFDRSKADRNLYIADGVMCVRGMKSINVSVQVETKGLKIPLKCENNKTASTYILNLEPVGAPVWVRLFPVGGYATTMNGSALDAFTLPLVLIEFDKSVDLSILLNNIVLGHIYPQDQASVSGMAEIGTVKMYRKNVLAFSLATMFTDRHMYLDALVLNTLANTLQLPILSVCVVDSMEAHLDAYAGNHPSASYMTPSFLLTGKKREFK